MRSASVPFHSSVDRREIPDQWEQLYKEYKGSSILPDSDFSDSQPESSLFPADVPSEEGTTGSGEVEEKSPVHYQYKGCYIMTAVKSGLMVIDQHRAHVRILYEQYLEHLKNHHAESQKTLFPEVVQFTASEAVLLPKILPEMEGLGFELTDLGGNSYSVNAVPAGLEGLNVIDLIGDMVSTTVEKGTTVREEINHSLALSLARNAAIPAGQVLDDDEMESVVDNLFGCSNVNYTPDGKRIFGILRQQEIEHLFD